MKSESEGAQSRLTLSDLMDCSLPGSSIQGIFQARVLVVKKKKNLPANAGDERDVGSISGSGRSLGGGDGNVLQDSCLENAMDRGA